MKRTSQELQQLLDTETGERKAVQFLAKNPALLRDYFISPRGHCQFVLTEVSLGGDYYMDAVVINGYSGAWEGWFIEFEPVVDPVFNKDGTPTARTRGAMKQIADWREYMRLNPTQFRRKLAKLCQTKDLLGDHEPEWEPCTYSNHRLRDPESVMWERFWIITGRRADLSQEVRALMARQQSESRIHFGSYDGLVDLAKELEGK